MHYICILKKNVKSLINRHKNATMEETMKPTLVGESMIANEIVVAQVPISVEEKEIEIPKPSVHFGDLLIQKVAINLAESMTTRLKFPVTVYAVSRELNCIKNGIITDDIPFNIEVYKELSNSGLNILHKEFEATPVRRRVIIDIPKKRIKS